MCRLVPIPTSRSPLFSLPWLFFQKLPKNYTKQQQENKGLGCLFPLVSLQFFFLLNTTAKEELNNLAQLISTVPDVSFMEAPFPTLVPLYSTSSAGVPWPAT
jgi:hypothetical protein